MEQEMEWKGVYHSEILMVEHMDAKARHKLGLLTDKQMREYDQGCLVSPPQSSSPRSSAPKHQPIPAYAGAQGKSTTSP